MNKINTAAAVFGFLLAITGAVVAVEERYAHQDDLVAMNGYIDRRFTESRIYELNRAIDALYSKARFGIPLTPYDEKHLEWLKFQLRQEIDRSRQRGYR